MLSLMQILSDTAPFKHKHLIKSRSASHAIYRLFSKPKSTPWSNRSLLPISLFLHMLARALRVIEMRLGHDLELLER